MKILLTGRNGQVGWELRRALSPLGEVIACDRERADLTKPETLAQLVSDMQPDIVVNAAAYTAVDLAEDEPDRAFAINRDSVGELAAAARASKALFIHYSTDYVFDGTKATPYKEDDSVGPLSVYGRSKLEGEEAVKHSGADWLIFRTTWVFASRGQNFVNTMLRLGRTKEALSIVVDQIGAPTSARLIAELTAHVVSKSMLERESGVFKSGLFNMTAAGATSWHEFAMAIFLEARARGAADMLVQEVSPIPATQFPTKARRPQNSILDNSAFDRRFGLHRPDWREGLGLVLDELYRM